MRKRSTPGRTGYMRSITVSYPFEKKGLDMLGPFPKSDDGNRYVVVAMEYLTRAAITRAVKAATSEEVAKFIVEDILLVYGALLEILTDRGRNLMSGAIEKLLQLPKTNHAVTTAYHPQCNGLVERFNRTFSTMLSMYCNPNQRNWDQIVPYVTFAYNTSRQESVNCSPFQLLHGFEARLPIEAALTAVPASQKRESGREAMASTQGRLIQLQELREQVRRRMRVIQAKCLRYNETRKPASFDPGDLVLLYKPMRKREGLKSYCSNTSGPIVLSRNLVM